MSETDTTPPISTAARLLADITAARLELAAARRAHLDTLNRLGAASLELARAEAAYDVWSRGPLTS